MPRKNTNVYIELDDCFIIKTIKNDEILVDKNDVDFVKQHSWYVSTRGYAYTRLQDSKKCISMHRLLMNPDNELQVDHINQNKLDNRRFNLRIVDNRENHRNMPLSKANKSGVVGVHFNKECHKWCAQLVVDGKCVSSTLHENKEDAIKKRKELELQYWD